MKLHHHRKETLATGAFDGGKITEIKPIGFPGEGGPIDRVGPLFYWSWATAPNGGVIGMHPHRGFEIMSYVIDGELGHFDTLGTRSHVPAGGAQVMLTGSGVSHEEHMNGTPTVFFQIWFEPDMRDALRRPPSYQEVLPEHFTVAESPGVRAKEVLGGSSPIDLTVPARMWDVKLDPSAEWSAGLGADKGAILLGVEGSGTAGAAGESLPLRAGEMIVVESDGGSLRLQAGRDGAFRAVLLEVDAQVHYPLYAK